MSLEEAYTLRDDKTDYGIYQIYGRHPVSGTLSLIYMGKAEEQVFGVRLRQEKWEEWEEGEGAVEVRVGRCCSNENVEESVWKEEICLAEKLLIVANKPMRNAQGVAWLSSSADQKCHNVHVLNWGEYGAILPEASGARWSSRFDTMPGFKARVWTNKGQ